MWCTLYSIKCWSWQHILCLAGGAFAERYRDFAIMLHQNPTAEGYAEVQPPTDYCSWFTFKRDCDWFFYASLCQQAAGDDVADQGFLSRCIKKILYYTCWICGDLSKSSSIATSAMLVFFLLMTASGYGFLQNQAQKPGVCPAGYTCILNAIANVSVLLAPTPAPSS